MRGAMNTIILITNHPDLLLVRIQPPEKATELQGSAGPGDSGGPAFIRSGGKAYVAGVGVSTDDVNADGIYGNYGDREIYTRVSSYAEWIDRTMRE
jgi:secreted trypsin-like serine protease